MRRWALAGVVLLLGFAGWRMRGALFPGEADRVRQFLGAVAADVSFGANEGGLAAGRRISRLVDRFAPDASIQLDILGAGTFHLSGQGEIQQTLWGARRAGERLEVRFFDIVLDLPEEKTSATAHLTATADAKGRVRGRHQEAFEAIEFRFRLRKRDGAWKIQEVETVPTLKQ